ncbi:uncharacterized protein LOC106171554 [Lingula anatina]|uniref:Uncharacterized protein LOC106171554 n=1 Tax=Lingula anatina TaxID=7574 RepID=A0A1S3JAQ7_LINAN|nr:uncharacterized protein LOC106171554 [Lingula anatina]|eukprot:XP_013407408.1 uncharacterized protein LOC106171554 [Lingula anatina]
MDSLDTPQKKKANHSCMQLLISRAEDVLRDVLNTQLQSRYPGLYGPSSNGVITDVLNDKTVTHTLLSLKSKGVKRKRILDQGQMDILYPPASPAPPVTLQDLGITLILVLLRNITNLNPHAKWDNPPATDTSTEANIARVKGYRNKHANGTDGLSDADIQSQFADLKAILLSLSTLYTNDDYDKLLIQPLDASETLCQLLSTKLPRTNTELKGRDDIITTIQQHIRDKAPLILLTGMGGIGKTSIAVKVGQNFQNVLYIDMRHVTDLNSVRVSLVQHYHPTHPLKDLYPYYNSIFKHTLSCLTTDTLLILDNSDHVLSSNREEFCDFLKDVTDSTNHITLLCTSRERFDSKTHNKVVVDIGPLDKTSSREVLWERKPSSPSDSESKALVEMANMCNHNPLALKLLAALLDEKNTEEVLEKMKMQTMLPTLVIPSVPTEITACLDISCEMLEPEAEKVFHALRVFPVAFYLKEVSDIFGLKQNDCEHILDSLAKKSLISADNGIYDIHPLLREYAEYKAQKCSNYICEIQDAYCSYYIEAFRMVEYKSVGVSKSSLLSVMLPHIKHTADLLIKQLESQEVSKKRESVDILASIANTFCHIYLCNNALHILKLVAHEQEALLGHKHPDTATTYSDIGNVLQAMETLCQLLSTKLPRTNTELKGRDDIITTIQQHIRDKAPLILLTGMGGIVAHEKEALLGHKHPAMAATYNDIGNVLQAMAILVVY